MDYGVNYITKENFEKEIQKIKADIRELQEGKADKETLNKIKETIGILNEKLSDMKDDNKDFKEELQKLSDVINNSNIDTAEMKANQKNIDEKIVDLKADIGGIQEQFSGLSKDIQVIRNSLDNSLWNTYVRLYKDYKFIRICTRFLIAMFIIIMFSSCFFYVSNGIPWDKIKIIRGLM
ncbi:hypothetical protein KYB31_09070 [Clostridium felsineum]|uniref:hypothetical protein n=1 Tax=Clostridium felsineum TaxID=36839 RepID=UPI00214D1E9C|nr:hypothetical protein [Clostridium felsineum]MCR3759139.1 hypothetical protein [Clostridium felsineum]